MGHSLAEWLTLREPFDVAARSERLAQRRFEGAAAATGR